jgi:hypothetical protein
MQPRPDCSIIADDGATLTLAGGHEDLRTVSARRDQRHSVLPMQGSAAGLGRQGLRGHGVRLERAGGARRGTACTDEGRDRRDHGQLPPELQRQVQAVVRLFWLRANQRQDCPENRARQPLPGVNNALQIAAKQCQLMTLQVPRLQRPSSAACLANDATTRGIRFCVGTRRGFESRARRLF